MSYRRPHPVRDPSRAAARLLEARTELLTLVRALGLEGASVVEICNAIETLEAAAENYGAVAADDSPPYVPVTPEELGEVKRALADWHLEIEERRRAKP